MYNNHQWTQARFNSFIKSALRSASKRWPPKYECIKDAKVGKKINSKSGRIAEHYRCNVCHGEFPQTDIQVDHIRPIIDPEVGFVSWDQVIRDMFCEKSGLQIVCKPCHKLKTHAERHTAKENKKNGK